jgi:hypothetical protein
MNVYDKNPDGKYFSILTTLRASVLKDALPHYDSA